MKEPIIETEVFEALPPINIGGVLELKHGEWCLRIADGIDQQEDGTFKVTRRWDTPDCEPWDRAFYRRVGV